MAKLLGLPVTLVIDASAMARSAAALIHGFVGFDHKLRIAGVILNNVGGEALAEIIREAVADDVAILGAIPHAPTSACLSATWASTCRARPGGTEPSG
jgi:cobyrinic acid a,c-diamide synthase